MRLTRILRAFLVFLPLACHESDDDGGGTAQTDFDQLVTGLIQDQTAEDTEPVEVAGTAFAFDEDETFDDVLPPDTGPVVGP